MALGLKRSRQLAACYDYPANVKAGFGVGAGQCARVVQELFKDGVPSCTSTDAP